MAVFEILLKYSHIWRNSDFPEITVRKKPRGKLWLTILWGDTKQEWYSNGTWGKIRQMAVWEESLIAAGISIEKIYVEKRDNRAMIEAIHVKLKTKEYCDLAQLLAINYGLTLDVKPL